MTKQSKQTKKSPTGRRFSLVSAAIAAGLVIGLAGIYGMGGFKRNADAACQPAAALAQTLKPLARGEVAAVNMATAPLRVPDLAFHDDAGKPRTLADWKGRTVLLNLWATWCVPCRREMPALDALQRKEGSPDFEVVSINIDTRDLNKPKTWLKEVGVNSLAYYADPQAKVFQDLKAIGRAFGMPTTLLIDGNRCEIGTIAGPAEWASGDAVALIEAALKK
ncbi:MAG: thiol:disulfide interchange protein TlpA [Pseudolabrys sp.]